MLLLHIDQEGTPHHAEEQPEVDAQVRPIRELGTPGPELALQPCEQDQDGAHRDNLDHGVPREGDRDHGHQGPPDDVDHPVVVALLARISTIDSSTRGSSGAVEKGIDIEVEMRVGAGDEGGPAINYVVSTGRDGKLR